MSSDPEVIVIGSGPNGLVAACRLAERGFKVLVLEANPRRPGGALGSEEGTLPGFVHDVGAAFFPFAGVSPAFRALRLARHGLELHHARFESCHPAPDGSYAAIARDLELAAAHFGTPRDGARFRELASWYRSIEEPLLDLMLGPLPRVGPLLRLGPLALLKLARLFASSGGAVARRLFESPAARRVFPGLALHVDAGPDDTFGAGIGLMLGFTATTGGYAVPRGGAQAITNALVTHLESNAGKLRLGARVERVVVREGRAAAVTLDDGTEIAARRGVLADTSAPSLLLDLIGSEHVPSRLLGAMRRFAWGWGTFKIDWALDEPVPWNVAAARESAVVHAGDDLDDLSRFTREVRSGALPQNPYLVIGQQSLLDPTRAPAGQHTLWAYSRVPSRIEGGWEQAKPRFVEQVEARIEALAPGFRASVLARRGVSPADLERFDANLVGGDLGGGSNAWHRQLVFRPAFPWFRYRMPVKALYLCSSYAHPGAGVHGMCGWNAAEAAARDWV